MNTKTIGIIAVAVAVTTAPLAQSFGALPPPHSKIATDPYPIYWQNQDGKITRQFPFHPGAPMSKTACLLLDQLNQTEHCRQYTPAPCPRCRKLINEQGD